MDPDRVWLYAWLTTLLWCTGLGFRQFFRVRPVDMEVVEGQELELPCHVGNRAGAVQWSKDGFVLGFQASIPGYPRYQMSTNESRGIYNLLISDVQLEDEGEFQCQVGPSHSIEPIRAKAHLTVLVPPKRLEIRHHANRSAVPVREGERVSLVCRAHESRPASKLRWFRNDQQLAPGKHHIVEEERARGRRRTSISVITLFPRMDDEGTSYSCEVTHIALTQPIRVSVTLTILHPPGPPEIEGYQEGEVVQVGDKLTLACLSRGGNPPPKLFWYRGENPVDRTSSTMNKVTTNTYTLAVDGRDNNAPYRCEVHNSVTAKPLEATIRLKVQYAPSRISLTGPGEAAVGERVTMHCLSSPSNPPAEIYWLVDGRPFVSLQSVTQAGHQGWVTASNVTLVINRQDSLTKTFTCHASSESLGETLVKSATVNILHPPSAPIITGYQEGKHIMAGDLQRFLCQSSGGNPLASLRWWKGNVEGSVTVSGSSVTNELLYRVQASDNGATYRCEAINPALTRPLATALTTHVYFGPLSLSMSLHPSHPKAGAMATIMCESGSSNPKALLTWLRDESPLPVASASEESSMSVYGGVATRSRLLSNLSAQDNGSVMTCRATNPLVGTLLEDSLLLNVLFKPVFLSPPFQVLNVTEGQSVVVNATAVGNPARISYAWFKERDALLSDEGSESEATPGSTGAYRTVFRGPLLHIFRADRGDEGVYVCQAANAEGTTNVTVVLNVLFPAKVKQVASTVVVQESESAVLECSAEGKPLPGDIIQWRRPHFDMATRTQEMTQDGRSFLTLANVSRHDAGSFQCVVYNGVGEESVGTTKLFVKFHPRVIRTPGRPTVLAASVGETVRLGCVAEGYPPVSFLWSRNGQTVSAAAPADDGEDLDSKASGQGGIAIWKSTLVLDSVQPVDFGYYTCVAQNSVGTDHANIKLRERGSPDPPHTVRVLNVTSTAATLTWEPGFDGGDPQQFQVLYRPNRLETLVSVDVIPLNASVQEVSGLAPDTDYVMAVTAKNTFGESDRHRNEILVKTLVDNARAVSGGGGGGRRTEAEAATGETGSASRSTAVIIVSLLSSLLLVCNAVLVTCFMRRRSQNNSALVSKNDRSGSVSSEGRRVTVCASLNGGGDAGTTELFLPPKGVPSPGNAVTDVELISSPHERACMQLVGDSDYARNKNYKRNSERIREMGLSQLGRDRHQHRTTTDDEDDEDSERAIFEVSSDVISGGSPPSPSCLFENSYTPQLHQQLHMNKRTSRHQVDCTTSPPGGRKMKYSSMRPCQHHVQRHLQPDCYLQPL